MKQNIKEGNMLEKLREFSIGLWESVGGVFNYLYESSNIWIPIIAFIVLSLLSIYLLHRLLNALVNVKININPKTIFPLLIKTAFILLIAAILFSLGFYIYDQYTKHNQTTTQSKSEFDYLLK